MNQNERDAVRALWRRVLIQEWAVIEDGEGPAFWRKACGMFSFFISCEEPKKFAFSAHAGDDEVIVCGVQLKAANLDEAMTESDVLISEIVEIGSSVLNSNKEIRIKQAFSFEEPRSPIDTSTIYHSIMGVGEDGKLYYFNGRAWEPKSMQLEPKS